MLPSLTVRTRKGSGHPETHSRTRVAENRCMWLGPPDAEATTLTPGCPASSAAARCHTRSLQAPWWLRSRGHLGQDMRVPPRRTALSARTCACSLTQSCPVLCDPGLDPGAHQAPVSMGLSRQEYWSGLPFPGTEPASPALVGKFFTAELSEEALSAGKETPKLRATLLEEEYHWRLTQQDLTQSGLTLHSNDTLKTQLGCPFPKEASGLHQMKPIPLLGVPKGLSLSFHNLPCDMASSV